MRLFSELINLIFYSIFDLFGFFLWNSEKFSQKGSNQVGGFYNDDFHNDTSVKLDLFQAEQYDSGDDKGNRF